MLRGQEQLRCGCGTVTHRQWKLRKVYVLLLRASQACCAVVVLRWTIILGYARDTYTLRKWTNACCRHGKKKLSVIPNLLHERQVWRAMYCRSMVISK